MTKKKYFTFEKELEKNGYRRLHSQSSVRNDGGYAYFKSFGESVFDEDRSNYQICFEVYDWRPYPQIEKSEPFSVELNVLISRHIDERVDILNVEIKTIEEAEKFAAAMFVAYENYSNKN